MHHTTVVKTRRPRLLMTYVAAAMSLITLAGCDLLARAMDENYDQRQEAKQVFEELNSQCPKPLNTYINLNRVDYLMGQVEYRYTISESGRSQIQLGQESKLKNKALIDLMDCPSLKHIDELDIMQTHVCVDNNDIQMMSFEIEPEEVRRFRRLVDTGKLDVSTLPLPVDTQHEKLKVELANLKHRPSASRAKAWVRALDKECPTEINGYTTLDHVKFVGKGQIEYKYTVLPEGAKHVNLDYMYPMQKATAEEMKGTKIGEAIVALDWSAMHVYRSVTDIQMLSYRITRKEIIGDEFDNADSDADGAEGPKEKKDFGRVRKRRRTRINPFVIQNET